MRIEIFLFLNKIGYTVTLRYIFDSRNFKNIDRNNFDFMIILYIFFERRVSF